MVIHIIMICTGMRIKLYMKLKEVDGDSIGSMGNAVKRVRMQADFN
jgi:hypothetical protein